MISRIELNEYHNDDVYRSKLPKDKYYLFKCWHCGEFIEYDKGCYKICKNNGQGQEYMLLFHTECFVVIAGKEFIINKD